MLLLVYKIINIYSHVLFFILIIWILIIINLVVLLVENFLYQVFAASNSNAFFSFKIIHLFILDIILLYRVLILVMLFVNILKLIFILIINHEIFFLLVFYLLLIILEIILVQLAIILNNLLHLLFLAAMSYKINFLLYLLLKMHWFINFKWFIASRLIQNIFFGCLFIDPLSLICNHFISILSNILFKAFLFFKIFSHNYFNCFFWGPNFSQFFTIIYLNFVLIILHFSHILIIVDAWIWNIFLYFFCKVNLFLCNSEIRFCRDG